MDPIDIFFRFVGLFYLVAAWFALRAMLMDSLLDKALAAITLSKEDPKERLRRQIIGAATVVMGTGGAALLLMSALALPLFAASLAAQGVWIAGARRLVIPAEDDDAQSVRQLVRSTLLYAAATLGVVWLWRAGRLGPWDDLLVAAAVAAAAAGLGGYFVYHLAWKPASRGGFADPSWSEHDDADADEPAPQRIVIEPAQGLWPLIDADTGIRFNHLTWLGEDLGWRVEDWDDVLQRAFYTDDAPVDEPAFASQEEEAAYLAEAEAIAAALRQAYGDGNVSFGPGWSARGGPAA